ncbi:hypothetical protein M409DRAFT_70318 [Zasmidium cellare ATCC 36951]|uniref:Autophagy-related protein n=1 Tax=Zasmidium cellare ATCC 36951 TaxID=1080233 RepID=A0A6A6C3X7_ZASCE|nr:uncharacterized protein M409DRAFT_70318 [Zasmidium cellare ATCC 36951]KAF2160562.1 hypothetical protein M409DRAFT_70318 [Zasmidium cellare ATCC 36951]
MTDLSVAPVPQEKDFGTAVNDFDNDDVAKAKLSAHGRAGYAAIEQEHTIPEDGERKTTTKLEYWSFCLFNWGATGVGFGNYGGALQQDLLESAFPSGYLNWGGSRTSTNSYILDINGITFAVQLAVLLITGPYADYGRWRPWILISWTVIGVAASFAFLDFTEPSKWQLASGFYVLGNLVMNAQSAFYFAAFPQVVRDLPQLQESERQVLEGTKTPEEHAELESMERSKMSNWSYVFSGLGSTVSIALAYAIAYGVGYSTDHQLWRFYSITTAYFGGIMIVTCLPWFIFDQRRPGQKLPDNTSWLTVGPKGVWQAAKNVVHLKHTLLYILAYFCLNDANSTSGTQVQILQNNAIEFNPIVYNGLYIVVYGATGLGILIQIWIQKKFRISAKTMFVCNAVPGVLISLWGMIGNWTNAIGFHHTWEFWLYQAWDGGASAAYQAYSTTLMAEVAPAPKMYIFFALFNAVGKTSGFIGPFISSAIIDDAHGNTNAGFYFTFALTLVGIILLLCVNVDQAKADCIDCPVGFVA